MTTEKEIKLMLKLNDVNNENHALRTEVDKLKRLLKECKDRFVAITTDIPINLEDCDLIRRIHQEVYDLETELLNERKIKKM